MTSATMLSEGLLRDGDAVDDNLQAAERAKAKVYDTHLGEDNQESTASLLETLKILEYMVDDDPNGAASVSSPTHWAPIRVSGTGQVSLLTCPMLDMQHQDVWSTSEYGPNSKSSGFIGKELETAVLTAIESQDCFPDLEHHRHSFFTQRDPVDGGQEYLLCLFQNAVKSCQSNFEYQQAYLWWKALQDLRTFCVGDLSRGIFEEGLRDLVQRKQHNINLQRGLLTDFEALAGSVEQLMARYKDILTALEDQRKTLRLKMWYVCDVKHSGTYGDALSVTRALRAMIDIQRQKQPPSIASWARQRLRPLPSNDKAAMQALDTLAAPKDHGGPTKLADQQAELTSRWLTKNSVENFCKGEERIHRFCHEIQKCANRLVGSNIHESPVLWSSNLFRLDKLFFDKGQSVSSTRPWANDDKTAHHSSWSGALAQAPRSPIFPGIASAPFSDFRKVPKPFPVSPEIVYGAPALSSAATAPVLPLGSRLPPTLQQATSPPHDPRMSMPDLQTPCTKELNDPRKAFASQIKRALLPLLLSDLGYLLWISGSETDSWINRDNLGHATHDPMATCNLQSSYASLSIENSPNARQGDALSDSTITAPQHERESGTLGTSEQLHAEGVKDHAEIPARHLPPEVAEDRPLFPFPDVFSSILERVSFCQDPYKKLDLLSELQSLVCSSLEASSHRNSPFTTQCKRTLPRS